MKKAALALIILCFALAAYGGFKAKKINAKKPGQFQSRSTVAGVTYAADLLLEGKDQEKYFYDTITPNYMAVRLSVFNDGKEEVVLPLNDLRLLNSEGVEFIRVDPEAVAKAVLGEEPININEKPEGPMVGVGVGSLPRYDPDDPRYDPQDPRYDPNDPRNRGQYPPDDYPPGSYPPGGPLGGPVIVLNPKGGGDINQIENERKMAAVDFRNKAHTTDPIIGTLCRDRFLYFSVPSAPFSKEGIVLILPMSRGIPQEVILKF
jgi:hypothetical protein